jgi:hypothetical protein
MEDSYGNSSDKTPAYPGFCLLGFALDGTWRGNRDHIRLAVIYPDFIAGQHWAPPFER